MTELLRSIAEGLLESVHHYRSVFVSSGVGVFSTITSFLIKHTPALQGWAIILAMIASALAISLSIRAHIKGNKK